VRCNRDALQKYFSDIHGGKVVLTFVDNASTVENTTTDNVIGHAAITSKRMCSMLESPIREYVN
jgi:hypothetical protein